MKPKLESLAPILAVNDVAETASYYRDSLGFTISLIAERETLPAYSVVACDGFEIHFLEDAARDPAEVRSGISVRVDDADALFAAFQKRGAFDSDFPRHLDAIREHGPEDKEYGLRDFIFVDPNGYILVFGHRL